MRRCGIYRETKIGSTFPRIVVLFGMMIPLLVMVKLPSKISFKSLLGSENYAQVHVVSSIKTRAVDDGYIWSHREVNTVKPKLVFPHGVVRVAI